MKSPLLLNRNPPKLAEVKTVPDKMQLSITQVAEISKRIILTLNWLLSEAEELQFVKVMFAFAEQTKAAKVTF